MRPTTLKTKIFLDGGDPRETEVVIAALGFLDGQTTNPTLIAKNPEAKARLERGEKFTTQEIYGFYKNVVGELSRLIPDGSISIEVYADAATSAEEMYQQGKEMYSWIPNPTPEQARYGAGAHIKFPITHAGLTATERSVREGMRVNLTLCFTMEQAAAVYGATRGATKGQVFVSPFVGRLDDRGENGMDFISNVIRMYGSGDGHVEVLTASVRSMDHFLYALALGSDIITAPANILLEWAQKEKPIPSSDYHYDSKGLRSLPFREIDLSQPWEAYDINDELTKKGIERFSQDWNALIAA